MDYFQGVVAEYLRSKRSRFINSECLIQLAPGDRPPKNEHWYCDIVATDFEERTVYLCEVTFARHTHALLRRLRAWTRHWSAVRAAIRKDCSIPDDWAIAVWVFMPEILQAAFLQTLDENIRETTSLRLEALENVLPWKYRSWNGVPYQDRG